MRVRLFILAIMFLVCFGCTGKHTELPKHAMTKNTDPVSFNPLDQIEKMGVKKIVKFIANFHPNMRVELPVPEAGIKGSWNVLVIDPFDDYKIKRIAGAYLKTKYLYTPWCNPGMEVLDFVSKEEAERCLYVLTDKSGTEWIMSPGPDGKYAYRGKNYDSTKLDNSEYRRFLFSNIGMSIAEIEISWQYQGLNTRGLIEEITVNSNRWTSFKKEFSRDFPYEYKIPGKGVVRSWLKKEEFKLVVAQNPGMTASQMLFRDFQWPIGTPEMMGFSTLSQLLNFSIKQLYFEPEYGGTSAVATIARREAVPLVDVWSEYERLCQEKRRLYEKGI